MKWESETFEAKSTNSVICSDSCNDDNKKGQENSVKTYHMFFFIICSYLLFFIWNYIKQSLDQIAYL